MCEESLTVPSFEHEVLLSTVWTAWKAWDGDRNAELFFILKLCAFSKVYMNKGISKMALLMKQQ